MQNAYHPRVRERRYLGLALTALAHAALLLGWQLQRHAPLDATPEPVRTRIQWIFLPRQVLPKPLLPSATKPAPAPAAAPPPLVRTPAAGMTVVAPGAPRVAAPVPEAATAPSAPAAAPPTPALPSPDAGGQPNAADILQRARRDVGAIDRALRKEAKPTIVAPPDSPAIRMGKGMQAAHDLAPPKLWEAPKVEALVNDTGDGARRERVITGNGTYCLTERSTATSIDMIEKHGKLRITTCPQHEQPATTQEWRTARD